jgi:RecB family exonuclease
VSIDVVTTGYGRPALQALRDVVAAAKGGEPLAPVTVVVPSNHVGVAARRLLAGGAVGPVGPGPRGVAGVTFLTAYRLAELLGAPRLAAAGRRPVSTPVVAAGLRRALTADPGVFRPVAAHPATETALVSAFAELSDVSAGGLDSLSRASRRASDVVRLSRRARSALVSGWYDEGDLVAAAVEAAIEGRSPVGDLGHVVIHLVQDLTQRQARLLRAVADQRPTTAVVGLTGAVAADAGVLRSLERLMCKAPVGPEAVVGSSAGAGGSTVALPAVPMPVAAGRTRILTASDADDEVRAAVRAVVDAARAGTPLERIAVLFGSPEPYGRLVHEHLAAAGIPRNGTSVRPLAASAVGRLLVDLLALPDHRYRRADVMGLLARSALRGPDGRPAPVGEWERRSREAGVVAGRDDWERLLRRLGDGLDVQADDMDAVQGRFAPEPLSPAAPTAPPPAPAPAPQPAPAPPAAAPSPPPVGPLAEPSYTALTLFDDPPSEPDTPAAPGPAPDDVTVTPQPPSTPAADAPAGPPPTDPRAAADRPATVADPGTSPHSPPTDPPPADDRPAANTGPGASPQAPAAGSGQADAAARQRSLAGSTDPDRRAGATAVPGIDVPSYDDPAAGPEPRPTTVVPGVDVPFDEPPPDDPQAAGDPYAPTDDAPHESVPLPTEEPPEAEPQRTFGRTQRRRAASVHALRGVVVRLIDDLESAAAQPRPWSERVEWIRDLAARFIGADDATSLAPNAAAPPRPPGPAAGTPATPTPRGAHTAPSSADPAEGGPTTGHPAPGPRSHWPPEELKAAEAVNAALSRLATLDEIDAPPTLDVFRRTLALELEADLGRIGRFGEGVLVAPLSFAVGLDLDLVVVLGMAEGTLPGPVRDDSLLPDGERQQAAGELPLRRDRVGRDHRHLIAALSGADSHLLCAPRGDLRVSNERVVSRWLLAAASALDGRPVTADDLGTIDADWVEHVPSFAHAVTHAAFPATEQDYRLRAGPERAPDPVAAAGAAVIGARRSRTFTRFDGNLSGVLADAGLPSPTDDVVSSTRLESWAVCPHAYFVRYLLRVDRTEDPERQLAITPLDKGSLVHEVLERFVEGVLARPADRQPAPGDPWTPDDHAAMAAIAAQVCDDYEARGLTGRPVFWRRDRAQILAMADRFLREDDRHRRTTRTRPVAAEMRFGREGTELDPIVFDLPDGRSLRFSGAVDRLDVADDGTIYVTDYKTGSSRSYKSLTPDDPDQQGTKLQLAVYGQAARAFLDRPGASVRADYWFVTDREGYARRGYEVDDQVLERVATSLTTIVEGIERGVFIPRPEDSTVPWVTCDFCDPDGLGTTELRRAWERKRDDPLVAPYAEMAEPRPEPGPPQLELVR